MSREKINQIDSKIEKWFAIRTGFRKEKTVAKDLGRKGIKYFAPLQTKTKYYGNRKRIIEKPIINGYIFVKILKSDYNIVLQTLHVFNFVKVGGDLIAIKDEEINLLKRIVDAPYEIYDDTEEDFKEGDYVTIISGELTGLKGKIKSIGKLSKIQLFFPNFDQFLYMEVPTNKLLKLKEVNKEMHYHLDV